MFCKHRGPSTSRHAARAVLTAAACLAGAIVPASAQAVDEAPRNIQVTVTLPGLATPNTAPVGTLGTGRLTITNTSGIGDTRNLRLSKLTVVPACSGISVGFDGSCLPAEDTITIVEARGVPGGACENTEFVIQQVPGSSGRFSLSPDSPVILNPVGSLQHCVVSFVYRVEHMPVADADAIATGSQTRIVAFVEATLTGSNPPVDQPSDFGQLAVTVGPRSPELSVRAPLRVIQVGQPLSVAAELAASNPSGVLTFKLYGPAADPSSCGALLQSFDVALGSGSGGYSHGSVSHSPPTVIATAPGTYHWTASWLGNANNKPVSSTCGEAVAATRADVPVVTPPAPPPAPPSTPGTATPGTGGTIAGTTAPGTTAPGMTPGAGTTPGTGVKRVRLDAFALTRRTFARASTATALAANAAYVAPQRKPAARKGTTIKYTLSAPATVTIVVERVTKGRRAGGYANGCVKATATLKKRRAKVCTLYTKVSTLKRVHKSAGAKKVAFSGRAGYKALAVGSYRLRAKAAAGAGTDSAERRTTFKIVRR